MKETNSNKARPGAPLLETVVDLLAKTVHEKGLKINADTVLFSSLKSFDSHALMEFILRLESTFQVSIPDEDLDRDTFKTPATIVAYLDRRIQGSVASEEPAA